MRVQRNHIIIKLIAVALVTFSLTNTYASTCQGIFTNIANSIKDEIARIAVTELENLNSGLENSIQVFQERKTAVKDIIKTVYTIYNDIKVMQEKQTGFNIHIEGLKDILEKAISPEELQEVITEAQSTERNHYNVILLSRHPSLKNMEEKLLKFDEHVQKLSLMRTQLADAIEIVKGRSFLLQNASKEAQKQWSDLNIDITEIENAIKVTTQPVESESVTIQNQTQKNTNNVIPFSSLK